MEHKYCAIYLSGTGNTKFCVEKFVKQLDENAPVFAIEDEAALPAWKNYEYIVLGYPVQYSSIPKMVRDFIIHNGALWKGKKVFCLLSCDNGRVQRRRRGLLGTTFEKVRRNRLGRSAPQNARQCLRQ